MTHEIDNAPIEMIIMMSEDCIFENYTVIDIGEDLARPSHQVRRSFMKLLHQLYQESHCFDLNAAKVHNDEYLCYLSQEKFSFRDLTLTKGPSGYIYHLYLSK